MKTYFEAYLFSICRLSLCFLLSTYILHVSTLDVLVLSSLHSDESTLPRFPFPPLILNSDSTHSTFPLASSSSFVPYSTTYVQYSWLPYGVLSSILLDFPMTENSPRFLCKLNSHESTQLQPTPNAANRLKYHYLINSRLVQ